MIVSDYAVDAYGNPITWGSSLIGSGWSFDLGATLQSEGAQRVATIRASLPPLKRTPAAQVPATELGAAYLQLSTLARYLADAYGQVIESVDYRDGNGVDHKAEAISNLARLIDRVICNYSFAEFAANPTGVFDAIINAPLFTWESETPPAQIKYDPFGLIAFPMQQVGARYRMPPAFVAYQLFAGRKQFGNFLAPVILDDDVKDFIGYGYDYEYQPGNGFVFYHLPNASDWYVNYLPNKEPPAHWCSLWRDYWHKIESERHKFNDKAERARMITWVVSFIAMVGFVGAIQAVAANGLTIGSGTKLLAAADRLPFVDFGAASPYISAVAKIVALDFTPDDAADSALDSADTGLLDTSQGAGMFDASWETDIPVSVDDFGLDFDFGNFDFDFGSFDSALDNVIDSSKSFFGDIDLTKLLGTLATTYVQYRLADKALESRGQPVPAATRPTPGTVRQLPDGTTLRTNNDGSTTVTAPTGEVRTVTTSGQIVSGDGSLIPGVPNIALFGGVALLGAAFLFSRK